MDARRARRRARRPPGRCTVAREAEDGPVVGYAIARLLGPEAELLAIATAPEARRTGVGRALLRELLDALDARGVEACFLEVRAGNEAAIALYEAHAFASLDRRRRYYDDGEDALILVRHPTRAT